MTVSVVVPAYNSGATIVCALESVLNQSMLPDEIIVVDDGSTDGTGEILKNFPEIRFIRQENQGPAAARNNGTHVATGEYIAFLDSDDYWEKDHLQNLMSVLENNRNLKWAATGYRKRLLNGKEKIVSLNDNQHSSNYAVDYFSATPGLHFLSVISTAVRRDLFLAAGGFAEKYSRGEDLSLWLRLALAEPVLGYSPKPTAVYVASTRSLTSGKGDLNALLRRISDDWETVCHHPPEMQERAWPVVKPWVSGILVKSAKERNLAALNDIEIAFGEKLTPWQKTLIRLCRLTGKSR